jgi:hypothetical protein
MNGAPGESTTGRPFTPQPTCEADVSTIASRRLSSSVYFARVTCTCRKLPRAL